MRTPSCKSSYNYYQDLYVEIRVGEQDSYYALLRPDLPTGDRVFTLVFPPCQHETQNLQEPIVALHDRVLHPKLFHIVPQNSDLELKYVKVIYYITGD